MQRIFKKVLATYKYVFNYNHLAVEHHWPNFMSICQLVMATVLWEENRHFAHLTEQTRSNPPQITASGTVRRGKNTQNKCSRKAKKTCATQYTQCSGRLQGTKRMQVWSATTPSPLGGYASDFNFIIAPKKIILSYSELKFLQTWHNTRHYIRTTKVLFIFF